MKLFVVLFLAMSTFAQNPGAVTHKPLTSFEQMLLDLRIVRAARVQRRDLW